MALPPHPRRVLPFGVGDERDTIARSLTSPVLYAQLYIIAVANQVVLIPPKKID